MENDKGPVSTILIIMAMHHEAAPIISKFGLSLIDNKESGLLGPMLAYSGKIGSGNLYMILNGDTHIYEQDGKVREKNGERVKVNRVGVVPAALSTWEGIRVFKPDIILSVGTAGGVHARGIKPRTVYLSEHPVKYFDRLIDFRAPGDDFEVTNYKLFGIGSHPVVKCDNLSKELNLPFAKVGTSSSFAHAEGNIKVQHEENEVAVKEMECAAIAGVTDFVDIHVDNESQNNEFAQNLGPVSDVVADITVNVVNFIMGKKTEHL